MTLVFDTIFKYMNLTFELETLNAHNLPIEDWINFILIIIITVIKIITHYVPRIVLFIQLCFHDNCILDFMIFCFKYLHLSVKK